MNFQIEYDVFSALCDVIRNDRFIFCQIIIEYLFIYLFLLIFHYRRSFHDYLVNLRSIKFLPYDNFSSNCKTVFISHSSSILIVSVIFWQVLSSALQSYCTCSDTLFHFFIWVEFPRWFLPHLWYCSMTINFRNIRLSAIIHFFLTFKNSKAYVIWNKRQIHSNFLKSPLQRWARIISE